MVDVLLFISMFIMHHTVLYYLKVTRFWGKLVEMILDLRL